MARDSGDRSGPTPKRGAGRSGQAGRTGRAGQPGRSEKAGHTGQAGRAGQPGRNGKAGHTGQAGRAGQPDRAGQAGQTGQAGRTGRAARAGRNRSLPVFLAVLGIAAVLTVAVFVGVRVWRNRQGQGQGQGRGEGESQGPGAARLEFRELGTVASGRPGVTAIAWRPDGARIAVGHADGSVSIWDADTRAELLSGRGKSQEAVDSMSWSPDGQLLAAAHRHDHMTVWNAANADIVWELDGGDVYSVVGWSEDGRSVKTYNGEEYYALWNIDSRACERSWFVSIAQQGEVVSPDRRLAAWESMAEGRWTLHRIDWQPGPGDEREWELVGHHGPVHGVSWRGDSSQLAGAVAGGVAVWSATSGQLVRSMPVKRPGDAGQGASGSGTAGSEVTYVSWSPGPDGLWILAGLDAPASVVIDAETGERLAEVSALVRGSSAWAPTGDRLATIGTDSVVHLYGGQNK